MSVDWADGCRPNERGDFHVGQCRRYGNARAGGCAGDPLCGHGHRDRAGRGLDSGGFSVRAAAVLLSVQALVFAVGAVGPARHPYGLMFRRLIAPRRGPATKLEAVEQIRFAQLMASPSAPSASPASSLGHPLVGLIATGFALFAALMRAVFGICLSRGPYMLVCRLRGKVPPAARTSEESIAHGTSRGADLSAPARSRAIAEAACNRGGDVNTLNIAEMVGMPGEALRVPRAQWRQSLTDALREAFGTTTGRTRSIAPSARGVSPADIDGYHDLHRIPLLPVGMFKQTGAHVLLTAGLADIETEIRLDRGPVGCRRSPAATH